MQTLSRSKLWIVTALNVLWLSVMCGGGPKADVPSLAVAETADIRGGAACYDTCNPQCLNGGAGCSNFNCKLPKGGGYVPSGTACPGAGPSNQQTPWTCQPHLNGMGGRQKWWNKCCRQGATINCTPTWACQCLPNPPAPGLVCQPNMQPPPQSGSTTCNNVNCCSKCKT